VDCSLDCCDGRVVIWTRPPPHFLPLRRPSTAVCAGKSDTAISGYTPADYITFSEQPEHACVHVVEAVVNAPADVCFALWDDWQRLVDFLDLVGQVRGRVCTSAGGWGAYVWQR